MVKVREKTNLCISEAELRIPRHSNNIMPARVRRKRKRVLVNSTHIALVAGRFALVAFQLTPPFGSSMLSFAVAGGPQHRLEA
jgi:hypothetical protein